MRSGVAIIILLLFLASLPAAAEPRLDEARRLVEQKEYGQALAVYSGLREQLSQDPALLTEWARVYAYADRHREAISLFETVRQLYPEYSKQILRELAEQYQWSDQLEKADAVYDQMLAENPKDTVALNGKARMLVWQGYNRQGIKRYQQIIAEMPDDRQARIELATAQHWDGRDDLSLITLNDVLGADPKNTDAQSLYSQIKDSQLAFVEQSNYHSYDKNRLDVTVNGLRTGLHLDPLTAAELIYQYQRSQSNATVAGSRVGVGLSKRLAESFEFNSCLYSNDYQQISFHPVTTDTWLTYKPDDRWRFDLSYNRNIFDDVGSLTNMIVVSGWSIGTDYRPDRFWLFSLNCRRGDYSDGNAQVSMSGRIEYRLSTRPYAKIYYNNYYSSWLKQQNSGYFNPRSINSQSIGYYISNDLSRRLFGEIKIAIGYENQDPAADHPTYFVGGLLKYSMSDNWQAFLRGEAFEATPDPNSNGYSKLSAALGLTYNFAVNPAELSPGQSSSRVTTR